MAGVVGLVDACQDVGVVDLARAELVAAGHVGRVEVADEIDVLRDVLDQVAFHDLLVVDVVEELDGGAVHGAADVEALERRPQVVALVVEQGVEGLDDEGHAGVLAGLGHGGHAVDDALVLLVAGHALLLVAHGGDDGVGALSLFRHTD